MWMNALQIHVKTEELALTMLEVTNVLVPKDGKVKTVMWVRIKQITSINI